LGVRSWWLLNGFGGRTMRTPENAERAEAPVEVTVMGFCYGAHARLGAPCQRKPALTGVGTARAFPACAWSARRSLEFSLLVLRRLAWRVRGGRAEALGLRWVLSELAVVAVDGWV
jgi:hypothetical protein